MPLFRIATNQSFHQNQRREIVSRASAQLAAWVEKPEAKVMVHLLTDQDLSFGGTFEPAAMVELSSLGLDESQAAELAGPITRLLSELLEISHDRIFIRFISPPRPLWSFDGKVMG